MSRNSSRVYVGNLPPNITTDQLLALLSGFGNIIYGELRQKRRLPFAFVEFEDPRDASYVITKCDGYLYEGYRLRVDISRDIGHACERFRSGGENRRARQSQFRITVSGLPPTASWQDLKDHMRKVVCDVGYANVYNDGTGVVEFRHYKDMKYAVRKLDGSKFRSHEDETAYIQLKEYNGCEAEGEHRVRSRSRTNSPSQRRGRRRSTTTSPIIKSSRKRSRSHFHDRC